MALCGFGNVYDLVDMVQCLRVDFDIWFSWFEKGTYRVLREV